MTKIYRVILPLLILMCFSCKKEMPLSPGLELSAASENNSVILNWSPVLLSGYKSINIYRSVSPIPDPLFNRSIDATLLIGTVSDKTITTFKDSNLVIGSSGVVYYKIVLNLTDRVIPSNEVQTSLDGFSISYNSNGFSNTAVFPLPDKNLLYILDYNLGIISVVDYSQKKIIKSSIMSQGFNRFYPVNNSGNPEFFISNNYSISCYNGITMASKYSITLSSNGIIDYKVKDNYLYVLLYTNNYYSVRTYDLSTQLMVGDKIVYSSSNGASNAGLYIGEQTNKLFFKYYTYFYNTQGNYVDRNSFVKYNLVNNLPADSVVLPTIILNPDSNSYNNNASYIQPSPDGKYLTCNRQGDILSLADNNFHSLQAGTIINPKILYSHTGNYLLAKSSFSGMNSNQLDVYSLPNFNSVMSVKSPNPSLNQSSSSFIKDDILDNDTLLSYNLKHTFSNSQTKSVLTVFFKKIN